MVDSNYIDPPRPTGPDPGYTLEMCIICVELAKQAITPSEARRALREMTSKLGKDVAFYFSGQPTPKVSRTLGEDRKSVV